MGSRELREHYGDEGDLIWSDEMVKNSRMMV